MTLSRLKKSPRDEDELVFNLVDSDQIAEINQLYLQHAGVTDVITFDYRDDLVEGDTGAEILGEIFVCPQVAADFVRNSDISVEEEVALYLVHGILHLAGHDDQAPDRRSEMRLAEAEIMMVLRREFDLNAIFDPTLLIG